MRVFAALPYSSQVDYEKGKVFPEYRDWAEHQLTLLESLGHTVFCALRADNYTINDGDPAAAFSLDEAEIDAADALIAFVTDKVSAGVQTEIGMAIAKKKNVVIAHSGKHALGYFNQAIILASQAREAIIPLTCDPFAEPE